MGGVQHSCPPPHPTPPTLFRTPFPESGGGGPQILTTLRIGQTEHLLVINSLSRQRRKRRRQGHVHSINILHRRPLSACVRACVLARVCVSESETQGECLYLHSPLRYEKCMIQMNECEGISCCCCCCMRLLDENHIGLDVWGGVYGTDCSINMTAGLLASRLGC